MAVWPGQRRKSSGNSSEVLAPAVNSEGRTGRSRCRSNRKGDLSVHVMPPVFMSCLPVESFHHDFGNQPSGAESAGFTSQSGDLELHFIRRFFERALFYGAFQRFQE